jgi:hypothetical protein
MENHLSKNYVCYTNSRIYYVHINDAHPASCTMGTGGPFPGGKARPGRDADHSPPSSAEVGNEYELYFLSPRAPPWRVAGQLCFHINDGSFLLNLSCVTKCYNMMRQLHIFDTGLAVKGGRSVIFSLSLSSTYQVLE